MYLYQYLLVTICNFLNNNEELVANRLPVNDKKIITLKKMLPILARIPGSFGILVNII